MAVPVASATVTANTTSGILSLAALPDGVEYFYLRCFNPGSISTGVPAYVSYRVRGGGATIPATDGVSGDAIPPQAAYTSPKLKRSDYPTLTAGPEFYAASSQSIYVTIWSAADGEQ